MKNWWKMKSDTFRRIILMTQKRQLREKDCLTISSGISLNILIIDCMAQRICWTVFASNTLGRSARINKSGRKCQKSFSMFRVWAMSRNWTTTKSNSKDKSRGLPWKRCTIISKIAKNERKICRKSMRLFCRRLSTQNIRWGLALEKNI